MATFRLSVHVQRPAAEWLARTCGWTLRQAANWIRHRARDMYPFQHEFEGSAIVWSESCGPDVMSRGDREEWEREFGDEVFECFDDPVLVVTGWFPESVEQE